MAGMTKVTVIGKEGSVWQGLACILPFGRLSQLDEDSRENPRDSSELAASYETKEIVWNV